jgi:PhoPQ-activated pathogenicity-related protein
MITRSLVVLLAVLAVTAVHGTPLDDYINKPDSHYKWVDTGVTFNTIFGGKAYVLNVTSQQWLDESKGYVLTGKNGAGTPTSVWTHQVVVIVPKKLTYRNISMAYLTGNCNEDPGVPSKTDEDVLVADEITSNTNAVGIVVFQIPNCPYVFPSDPSKKHRTEDAVLAWAWHEFLEDPNHSPEWLPRLPMAKAAFQCMRAVEEFTAKQKIAEIEGWFVAGASKRGWTTWMVGSATCESCPTILGIAPLVPIVPNLVADMHRQWMAYGGWTFAFSDYIAVNLTLHVDDPVFTKAMEVIDPMYYGDRLARLPKVVVLSSDDEFMMMDQSNIWYDELTGEKHLLIAPNSEHSLATGIPEVLDCLGTTIRSIAAGNTNRPNFDYKYNETDGSITVTIPEGMAHGKVVLRHAQTMQDVRRDFRWVRQANNHTQACKWPFIPLKKPLFGGNCIQPIIWLGTTLKPTVKGGNVYRAEAPKPKKEGHWTGYYVEMYFPSDTDHGGDFQFTTPGYTWPNTLPFKDCHGKECIGRLV